MLMNAYHSTLIALTFNSIITHIVVCENNVKFMSSSDNMHTIWYCCPIYEMSTLHLLVSSCWKGLGSGGAIINMNYGRGGHH